MSIHDLIVKELERTRSLGALIYLIERGRELEFTAGGEEWFLSRHGSQKAVSLWNGQTEQSFDSMEELLENAVVSGAPFLAAWETASIETIF